MHAHLIVPDRAKNRRIETMNYRSKFGLLMLLGIGINGCTALDPESIAAELTAEALHYIINSDPAFSLDGLTESEFQDEGISSSSAPNLSKTMADTLWPRDYAAIRSRRRITSHELTFTIDTQGSDTAMVTITGTMSGTLTIGAFVQDSAFGGLMLADTIVKAFELTVQRRVRLVNTGSTEDSSRGWKVDALTALSGTIGSKVALEEVTLVDSNGTLLMMTPATLMNTFYSRDNLPTVSAFQTAALFVTVSNEGPEFPVGPGEVVNIHRVGRHGDRAYGRRRHLNDRGVFPDVTAGDNVYSRTITIAARPTDDRPFRLFVDVIDISSILVASEALHQAFIGIPYRIDP